MTILPAYFGLALSYEKNGMHSEAVKILNSAPEVMKLNGEIIATKDKAMREMVGE